MNTLNLPHAPLLRSSLIGLLLILIFSAFWLLAEVFDGDIDGYADAEPLGTADGYVWSSECPTPIPTSGDAAPAIERCMDALGSGTAGGTLFMGKGPYTLNTPVDVSSGTRTKVVIQGAGNAYNGATVFNVGSGTDGFVIDTGGTTIASPEFTNLRFNLTANSTAIRVESAKRTNIYNSYFAAPNGADNTTGIELDSNQRTNLGSDASYGHIRDSYFEGLSRAIYMPDRGGSYITGGHIALRDPGDIGIEIGTLYPGTGYQYRVDGLRIDGGTSTATKMGEGIRTYANSLRMGSGVQMESPGIGVHVMRGSNNIIDGSISANFSVNQCYVIESAASNTHIADTFKCSKSTAAANVNKSTTTTKGAVQSVAVN
jgi:hypothetical protein